MLKGRIFNIEEFGVHDGPGIRKIVFFKGCHMHCSWCHNPEGISFQKEPIKTKNNRETICGTDYAATELSEILLKGKEVLISSGGGITISGGEPLAQPEFLLELMDCLKPVHLVVETSGYGDEEIFKKMTSKTDIVFLDIKQTDTEIHKKFTGVKNDLIFKNLEYLCGANSDFVIRIPLIQEVNDTKENIRNTAKLIQGAKHLLRVELLPYHKTAGAKYPMIGKEFNPQFDTDATINFHENIFNEYNINAVLL